MSNEKKITGSFRLGRQQPGKLPACHHPEPMVTRHTPQIRVLDLEAR